MRREDIGSDLVRQAEGLRSDLEPVRQMLDEAPEELLARAFPERDRGLRPRAIVGDVEGMNEEMVAGFDQATQEQRRRILEAGARAFEKVTEEGKQAQLGPAEQFGLEAIIRFTARPAILIRDAGSPVVDLGGGLVLGLHYASRWEPYKRGDAVALWALADEPLLQAAGVKFDEGEAT